MTIIEALILFLPAGIANATPVLVNKVNWLTGWQTPMDFGQKFRSKRIFGPNKTWRGLVFGTLAGIISAIIILRMRPDIIDSVGSSAPLVHIEMGLIGGILGFGALYGDAIESFFKRQKNVPAGQSWFPYDQIDYIIGALIAIAPLGIFGWSHMIAILFVYFWLHLLVAYIGFRLKFKSKPI